MAVLQPTRDPSGLDKLVIANSACTGEIYLQGGHVTRWQPVGAKPVLFMSEKSWFAADKPIRGGVPLCLPWFGPRGQAPAGAAPSPAHGFVRLRPWRVCAARPEADAHEVVLETIRDGQSYDWPQSFTVHHALHMGKQLDMILTVTNTGSTPMTFEAAQHTYFAVSDVRQVTVDGLDGTDYLDKVDGAKRKTQSGPITITGETDRIYLDTTGDLVIVDPLWQRRIRIHKENSRNTVVWNPWIDKAKAMPDFGDEEWPGMICVETCNVKDDAVTLAPGASHVMATTITVE